MIVKPGSPLKPRHQSPGVNIMPYQYNCCPRAKSPRQTVLYSPPTNTILNMWNLQTMDGCKTRGLQQGSTHKFGSKIWQHCPWCPQHISRVHWNNSLNMWNLQMTDDCKTRRLQQGSDTEDEEKGSCHKVDRGSYISCCHRTALNYLCIVILLYLS